MNELIKVTQLPVIEQKFRDAGELVDKRLEVALSLVCTEESVKEVKKLRAELNKEQAQFDAEKNTVKAVVLAPWNSTEATYKECISSKYKDAVSKLSAKIDDVESGLKLEKLNEIKEYFAEYAESLHLDWLTIDRAGLNVTLSVTVTALKKQAQAFIDRVESDIGAIEAMENSAEILVEYKQHLDLARATIIVSERHKALEREAARKAEALERIQAEKEAEVKVEAFAPPVVVAPVDDPVMRLSFKVKATKSKLKLLKQFLEDGGYQCE